MPYYFTYWQTVLGFFIFLFYFLFDKSSLLKDLQKSKDNWEFINSIKILYKRKIK
jgi:hypothetical protein